MYWYLWTAFLLGILHFKIELWGCDAELGGRRYALYSSETAMGAVLSRPSCDGGWSEHLYRVGLLSDLTLVLAPWIFKVNFLLNFWILNYGQHKNKTGVLPYSKSLQWYLKNFPLTLGNINVSSYFIHLKRYFSQEFGNQMLIFFNMGKCYNVKFLTWLPPD